MDELTNNLNWLAVGVSTVVSFVLGWIWYSPKVFGTKWAEGVGVEMTEKPPAAALVTQLVFTFLLAWVVGVTAANQALFTIILITITIVFLIVSAGLWAQKSAYAIATEAGFIVAMVLVMIIIHGII